MNSSEILPLNTSICLFNTFVINTDMMMIPTISGFATFTRNTDFEELITTSIKKLLFLKIIDDKT